MIAKIQKWGNSQGVRVPMTVLKEASLSIGENVDIIVNKGKIVVTPALQTRGKYCIKGLVSRLPRKRALSEKDWSSAIVREAEGLLFI
jgi:antitoxin MazE